MTKEIIIDGVAYNKCDGCPLWDNTICICMGAKSYEDNAEIDKQICNEHLATQFWVVSRQLKRAEQKLKGIKEIVVPIKENTCFGMHCGAIDWILQIIEGDENG